MFQEVPIKQEPNIDHPMYKRAIRDALAIIDKEIKEAQADRETTQSQYGNFYYDGKLYGFRRIRGLLAATIEEEEEREIF